MIRFEPGHRLPGDAFDAVEIVIVMHQRQGGQLLLRTLSSKEREL